MQTAKHPTASRRPTNLSLDSVLLAEAKALEINVSRAAESGIETAVKEEKRKLWLQDNAAAIGSSNAYVEANGLPLSRHRQF